MARVPIYPLVVDIRETVAPIKAQVCGNMHFETDEHFLEAHVFSYDRLVITFEDARVPTVRPDRYRQGWGVSAFLKRGVSVMAVKPKQRDWYSSQDLPQTFRHLQPFLSRFGERITYGTSMGGFGALTYADLVGAKRVVAIVPQTLYRAENGIQEDRYVESANWDHSHPFADAAEGCKTPEKVFLLYDPWCRMDAWHVGRLKGANLEHICLPYSSHNTAVLLQYMGGLNLVADLVMTGQIDRAQFYQLYRGRRAYTEYVSALKEVAERHPSVQARLRRILLDDAAAAG